MLSHVLGKEIKELTNKKVYSCHQIFKISYLLLCPGFLIHIKFISTRDNIAVYSIGGRIFTIILILVV